MTSSTTETVTLADGISQFRRRWSPTGDARAAMLLVHGIGEHSGRYDHVGHAFAEVGIDVVAHDQRGFGQSGGRRGDVERFGLYLDDVQNLLGRRRALGVPTILFGHSLGGLISTTYLVSRRPQPDLAVLSSPALAAEIPGWQKALAPAIARVAPGLRIPADFDGSVLSRDEAVQVAYENDPLRVASSTARLGREILTTMTSTNENVDRIGVPTYVLHGSDDRLVPPSASEPLALVPGVTRRVWDGLRHECLNEPEQDAVIAEIVAWIDTHL